MMHCVSKIYTDNKLRSFELAGIYSNDCQFKQEIRLDKTQVKDLLTRRRLLVDNIKIKSNGVVYQNAPRADVNIHWTDDRTNIVKLYHGQKNRIVKPKFGLGEDKHDYGKGFYTTKDLQLACEWAACDKEQTQGYVHAFELDLTGLNILNFDMLDDLNWIAELLQHRWDSKVRSNIEYRRKQIISRYKIDTQGYDLIVGWRADQSYFRIAKVFLDDKLSIQQLREALRYGDLGVQYTLKQEKAYSQLKYLGVKQIDYQKYSQCYWSRDGAARYKLRDIENRVLEPGSIRIQTLLAEGELI